MTETLYFENYFLMIDEKMSTLATPVWRCQATYEVFRYCGRFFDFSSDRYFQKKDFAAFVELGEII